MNKAYSLVWNDAQGGWCAVGETARRRGKSSGGKRLIAATGVSLLGLAASGAHALPAGGAVAAGHADIATSADGKTMSINQHSDKLITNWHDFSVGGGERVSFQQPTSQSIALNRVIGSNGSQIHGRIDANGRVFLVNPNGVMFGAGAQVNVGGLVASTQGLSDADFLAGRNRFAGTSGASVVNAGTITAAEGGGVALLGARVSNTGVIRAQMGQVALGAGNAFNVNFDGKGLLNLQVEGGAVDAQAHNGGLLKADGGEVLMTARAAGNLLGAVVNNTGTIEARGLSMRNGKITLDGGLVQVGGRLDASARDASAAGGSVTTRGERVVVSRDVQVDTRAASGRMGQWTIEAANAGVEAATPVQRASTRGLVIEGGISGNTGNGNDSVHIGIGGSAGDGGTGGNGVGIVVGGNGGNGGSTANTAIDAATLARTLGTTNVALTNTSGDLTVGGAISWTGDNALTLTSQKGNVNLNRAVTASGERARVTMNAAGEIRIGDKLALTGERARVELNSAKGHRLVQDAAVVTLSGKNASFASNGDDYRVIHDTAGLRGVDGNLKGRYVLGNAIDGKGAQFRSIGGGNGFSGVFDGLGNTIANLSITNTGFNGVGLFSANGGRIANLALEKITAKAYGPMPRSTVSVGALAGYNGGEISNVTARDVAVSGERLAIVGGLVGSNISGSIDRVSVSGRVDGGQGALRVGGLVGDNMTTLERGAREATVANSRADVQVGSRGGADVGGLVGFNRGTVKASTASGSVTAMNGGVRAGGLVGVNEAAIGASSSTGKVSVGDRGRAGGLVGENRGVISASTADGEAVAGASGTAGGLVGVNHAQILASTANGAVKGGNAAVAGGLVGHNAGMVSASTANGNVSAGAKGLAGGLVGRSAEAAQILASFAHGNVSGLDNATVGGLVGSNDGTVDGSSAYGVVKAGARSRVGGLAGVNAGSVTGSGASGPVSAGALGIAGGLVGEHGLGASIEASTSTGAVQGGDRSSVGGLVGNNGGRIASSTSSGKVSGGRGARLGGLAGGNFGVVERSTTSSRIAYTAGYDQFYGGLAGINAGWMSGNSATGSAASVPLAGLNFGTIGN
ncbi:filamentous hemagglutinin N-terminal domain-containing protein [Burkholderia sp. Bp9126]|nr:filamentous hemagglutinin N-terminal domain-containing protein [Burkholderia sp. Bp9126]